MKQNKHVFSPKIMLCKLITVSFTSISGINQPPVNSIAASVDINTIEQYSPKKKKTKIIELCSVKKPATNSDSKLLFIRLPPKKTEREDIF